MKHKAIKIFAISLWILFLIAAGSIILYKNLSGGLLFGVGWFGHMIYDLIIKYDNE